MSALSIQPTYPIFTDTTGQPLENGYIWVGTTNLNPVTNPITVYWDAALTVPASQPIRTLNGYPSNSGTPARLYVNSDYSIQVLNKNGSVVYSAPAATERYNQVVVSSVVNAQNVIYDPPFSGSTSTNAEAKFSQVVSVKDFGAVGDWNGTSGTNDTVAIQTALDYLRDNGGVLEFPTGRYLVTSALTLQRNSNLQATTWIIDGRGSEIYSTISAGSILKIGATSLSYFVESGGTTIRDLNIRGIETDSGSSGNPPDADQTGIEFYIAGNINLNNITVFRVKTGIKTMFTFPLIAVDVNSRGNYVGVHLDEASNLQEWLNLYTPESRYGLLIKSTSTAFDAGNINNVTFHKWWCEGSMVGCTIDSGSGGSGQPRFRSFRFVDSYIAGIDYDAFRIARVYDFATPATRGSTCSEFVLDFMMTGGVWNITYSATSSALVFGTSNRVRQFYCNIPIPTIAAEANSWVGTPSGGIMTVNAVPNTATTGETTIYMYDKTGVLIQKQSSDGTIDFYVGAGIRFNDSPVPAGVSSQLFNDYEEGVFTPTIIGTTSAGVGTYSYNLGRYTKIGDCVTFDITIAWTNHTGTGNMQIAGLPYLPQADFIFSSCSVGTFDDITLTASNVPLMSVRDDAARIQIKQLPVGGGTTTLVPIDISGGIYVSGSYRAA